MLRSIAAQNFSLPAYHTLAPRSGSRPNSFISLESEGEEAASATTSTEKKPAPGTRSKQKKAGLIFPIIKMRQNLVKGKMTNLCLLAISDIFPCS